MAVNFLMAHIKHSLKDCPPYITFSSPLPPSTPYTLKKKKNIVEGTCVLFVLLAHDIQRVHRVQSTTCVLSLNPWKSFIPRKADRLFLCHPNGRLSQIPDDEGAPEGP